jgi:uroporphyrinogen decarboxylase
LRSFVIRRIVDAVMTSRERVLESLAHREPDLVPVCLAYETPQSIAERYGVPLDPTLMRQDVYAVGIDLGPPDATIRSRYHAGIPADARLDSWGVATWRSSTGDSHAVRGPLVGMRRPDELDGFPFPVPPSTPSDRLLAEVALLQREGFAVQGAMSQTIFELAWNLYGMEDLMVSFVDCPDFAERLLDEITKRKCTMARCFVEAGVDVLRLGDDVGSQRGLMISPAAWRRFLKPRLAAVIEAGRAVRRDVPVFYHSDGDVRDVIDELVEIGVTILNPVQPECMDPFEIKKRYGSRLTLWGTIGTQTTLPKGPPEAIRATVRDYIGGLAPGGGFVIGPTHSINRDVPWEHLFAFYEAVRDFGSYRRS